MKRPRLECDCHICRDDSITMCLSEANRLLQINYADVPDEGMVEIGFEHPGRARDPQQKLGDFA